MQCWGWMQEFGRTDPNEYALIFDYKYIENGYENKFTGILPSGKKEDDNMVRLEATITDIYGTQVVEVMHVKVGIRSNYSDSF